MRIIHKAIICLALLMISGCSLLPPKSAPDKFSSPTDRRQSISQTAVSKAGDVGVDGQAVKQQAQTELWALIKSELQFEHHLEQRSVQEKIAWFSRKHAYLDRVSKRAEPYLFYIVTKLKERSMPLDLALLPIVESAYNPFAYSPSHASGIWQFIPATGRRYGMKQNWWYDGRRDIIAATDGALDYLQALHQHFEGNWFHAIAAYNAGEGNVEKAIMKNRKAGKKTDFWALPLPGETKSYLPSLLAIAAILKNSEQYQLRFKGIPNKPYFKKIDIDRQIDLATVARITDLSIEEVYLLNPGFNRWATAPQGPHRLLIPIEKATDFERALATLPRSEWLTLQKHQIRRGESLSQIASRYQTSVAALKKMNRLKSNIIRAGHSLLIPTSKETAKFYTLSADVRRFKGLKTTSDGARYIYTVKRGDNLWDISRKYGLYVKQLTRWNNISRKSLLQPRQKLTIWVKQNANLEKGGLLKTKGTNSNAIVNSYTVRRGDSLWSIAKKFDVLIQDLRKWNNLKKGKYLQPGQNLIIHQQIMVDA